MGSSTALLSLVFLVAWLAACSSSSTPAAGPEAAAPQAEDPQAQAAAEATAIIQQARATALVLQARAQATALIQQAQPHEPAVAAWGTLALPVLTPTSGALPAEASTPPAAEVAEVTDAAGDAAAVELVGVGFAADGGFVIVSYRAPPAVAQTFWPGVLSVTDEARGTVFNEVPVMPVIGPLIGRPVETGQLGYVMLVHAPPILRSGSRVTVVLADYRFEHVVVE
jgi:hypothetical protein